MTKHEIKAVSDKGQIIGGQIHAGKKVEANTIGTSSGIKTEIFLGYNFKVREQMANLKQEREKTIFDLQKIAGITSKIMEQEKDINNLKDEIKKIYVESIRKKVILTSKLKKIKSMEDEIDETKLIISHKPELIAYDTLHADVKIHYLNKLILTTNTYNKIRLSVYGEDNKLLFKDLNGNIIESA